MLHGYVSVLVTIIFAGRHTVAFALPSLSSPSVISLNDIPSDIVKLSLLISFLVVFHVVVKFLKGFYKLFLRPAINIAPFARWAVVTGATDGIGKAYALGLAKKGKHVVLISRTEAKLKEVKKEIEDKGYGVDVKYIVCDYSKFDEKAKANVKNGLKDLDVGILINNVGVSYRYPMYFHEVSDDEVSAIVEMNVNSTVWMTRFVIEGMLALDDGIVPREKGAIINISSGSALYPMPLLAEYAAAKTFIEKFSIALNAEYSSKGIFVQCQTPFYVATKLAKMRKSFLVPTPDDYVKRAIKFVGHSDSVVQPFWGHALMSMAMDHIPSSILTKIVMSMHMATRAKGKKKDAKIKAA